jgi:hypothetical protein
MKFEGCIGEERSKKDREKSDGGKIAILVPNLLKGMDIGGTHIFMRFFIFRNIPVSEVR